MSDRRAATTIGELDIHLGNVQAAVSQLVGAVSKMATKDDLQIITEKMSALATKEELRLAEARWARETMASTLDRWLSTATRIGIFLGVTASVIGGMVAMVHFLDRVPK